MPTIAPSPLVPHPVFGRGHRVSTGEDDRRRDRRFTPQAEASPSPDIRLVDISMLGCCLAFAAPSGLRPGQFVTLRLACLDLANLDRETACEIRAIVRWNENRRVGLEFTRSLPAPLIDAVLDGGGSGIAVAMA
ncbi:PilZ domain-containing protein [Novosphingobium nitrogenifigens]|uniref:PilZ domain-containing protein n=1 Tax=Novosphingobium nitrogenifigens TaxID=378548 RepID=UPI000A97C404|nr:PilZ domain-containing protein [Novosphingobium nitrogenifigens]